MRRFDLPVAVEADVSPAMVVRQDKQDVRPLWRISVCSKAHLATNGDQQQTNAGACSPGILFLLAHGEWRFKNLGSNYLARLIIPLEAQNRQRCRPVNLLPMGVQPLEL